jgi:hypothetical protein
MGEHREFLEKWVNVDMLGFVLPVRNTRATDRQLPITFVSSFVLMQKKQKIKASGKQVAYLKRIFAEPLKAA